MVCFIVLLNEPCTYISYAVKILGRYMTVTVDISLHGFIVFRSFKTTVHMDQKI